MKLRIKGDSLRLRISPSEMSRLLQSGRVEETVHLGPRPDATFTYALLIADENPPNGDPMTVHYQPSEITVIVAAPQARAWAGGHDVGIYAGIDTGAAILSVAVEKDFACLDKDEIENRDTFPNPHQGTVC